MTAHDQSNWTDIDVELSMAQIQACCPYVTLEPQSIVTMKDGSVAGGIEIFPTHLNLLSGNELNEIQKVMADAVNSLPFGSSVQFDLLSSTDITGQLAKHHKDDENIGADREIFEIERAYSQRRFAELSNENKIRSWRQFVFINYHEPRARWNSPKKFISDLLADLAKSFRSKGIIQEEMQAYADRSVALQRVVESMENSFRNLHWHPRVMQVPDWCDYLFQIMNPRQFMLGNAPLYPSPDNADFCRCILFSQLQENGESGGFRMDGYHHSILTMPEIKAGSTVFGILRVLTNKGIGNMRISVTGHPCDPDHYLNEVRKDIRGLRDELTRDPDNENTAIAIRDRITEQRELAAGDQKVFESRITLHLWNRDFSALQRDVAELAKVGQEMGGAKWLEETYNAAPYFFSSLPGWTNDHDDERLNEFKSRTFVDLLPTFGQFDLSNGLDPNDPGIQAQVLIENRDGGICGWNPYDTTRCSSLHGIVIGKTRSGKSVISNIVNMAMMPLNPRIVSIDLGYSSRVFTELCGGTYFTLLNDPSNPDGGVKRINPFGGYNVAGPPTEDDVVDLSYVLERLFIDPTKLELDNEERAILFKAIQQNFRDNPNREVFMGHFHATLSKMRDNPIARSFSNTVSSWCNNGPFAKFVDGPSTDDLDHDIVGFELSGIEKRPQLLPVIVAMILNHASRNASHYPGIPKLVWVDEFAVLGQNPMLARYVEIAYRTYGKTGTGIWTMSQQLGDYELCCKDGHLDVLLNAAGQFAIFQQEDAAQAAIYEHMGLSRNTMRRISEITTIRGQYSEAVLLARQQTREPMVGSVVIRSNPIRYWITSSSPNDRDVRDALTERFRHFEPYARARMRAVLTLAEYYPQGYDAEARGNLTPRMINAMKEPQEGDDLPWDPMASPIAAQLGLTPALQGQFANR
jgi:type IV secretory pathway VirB4 component